MTKTLTVAAGNELIGGHEMRDFQRQACAELAAGRSVLLVAPTGAGKSLCYQVMTRLTGRPTLILSPLIALMDDQASKAVELGFSVGRLHSGVSPGLRWSTLARWVSGKLQLLFTSPERLRDPRLRNLLCANPPGLVVVDEAHCIATWGRRFRPAYREIGDFIRSLDGTPTLAMTATANAAIQADIVDVLGLTNFANITVPLTLANLNLEAIDAPTGRERAEVLGRLTADDIHFPMVIFCVLKKQCDSVVESLRGLGVNASGYHAGMSAAERVAAVHAFQADDRSVLVATSAYEMGIDDARIRSVVHYGLPASLESYVQAIGRAGRGGGTAKALLLYGDADLDVLDSLETLAAARVLPPLHTDDVLNLAAQEVFAFALTKQCRREYLRRHFDPGSTAMTGDPCGRCDNCKRRAQGSARAAGQRSPLILELKRWRKQLAAASQQASFTIFTDRELARIAAMRPATEAELAQLAGLRRPSVARYGSDVIEIIRGANEAGARAAAICGYPMQPIPASIQAP